MSDTITRAPCIRPLAAVGFVHSCLTRITLYPDPCYIRVGTFGAICTCFSLLYGCFIPAEVREIPKFPLKSPPQALIMGISAAFCDLYYTYTPPSSFWSVKSTVAIDI